MAAQETMMTIHLDPKTGHASKTLWCSSSIFSWQSCPPRELLKNRDNPLSHVVQRTSTRNHAGKGFVFER